MFEFTIKDIIFVIFVIGVIAYTIKKGLFDTFKLAVKVILCIILFLIVYAYSKGIIFN